MSELEYEGRTEEEAIQKALDSLGLESDEIDVEVVETQSPKLFKGAKVRIRVHFTDEEIDESGLKPESSFEKEVLAYVTTILEKTGVECDVQIQKREQGRLYIEIIGDDPGIIIGKHGNTLESLQILTSIYAGRLNNQNDFVRVVIDTEDYRYRREQNLIRMAKREATNVRRSQESSLLEPLNAFERRIIHSALSSVAYVSTESEGDGLYKQIRISYVDKEESQR